MIENANLVIKQGLKLELVLYIRYSRSFLGLCKDVEIIIEGLKLRYPIFIVEASIYNLVWGQSFLNFVKFSQKYKPDRIFNTIT